MTALLFGPMKRVLTSSDTREAPAQRLGRRVFMKSLPHTPLKISWLHRSQQTKYSLVIEAGNSGPQGLRGVWLEEPVHRTRQTQLEFQAWSFLVPHSPPQPPRPVIATIARGRRQLRAVCTEG